MAADGGQCVICFESTSQSAASLPCACNVQYCTRCWDRALAESFNACDQARCPTCRQPVHVDFDPVQGSLVFSQEAAESVELDPAKAEGAAEILDRRQRTVNRLLEQARPLQVRLLRQYGEQHRELQQLPSRLEAHIRAMPAVEVQRLNELLGKDVPHVESGPPEDLVAKILQGSGSADTVAACWSVSKQVMPRCVCGSFLRRVSLSGRITRIVELMFSGAPREFIQEVIASGQCAVICDICAGDEESSSGMWTCENGDSTILHATAYDVCDVCFVKHVCSVEATHS